jgi:DNA polymerase-3 subunit gamma/tau
VGVRGAARELARNAELQRQENGVYDLVVPKAKAYLADRAYVDKLKAALDQHLGAAVRVNVSVGEVAGASAAALEATEREARRAEALKSVQGDGFVQDLVNIFEAKVVDSSMRERDK